MSGSGRTPQLRPAEILAVLDRHKVAYVLVGGFAAQLHGATKPTTDIDVTPGTSPDNLDRLAAALRELGAGVRVDELPESLPFDTSAEALAGMRTLNLRTPFGDLDLTFEPDGTRGYDDLTRTRRATHHRRTAGPGRQPGRHHPLQTSRRPTQRPTRAARTGTPRPTSNTLAAEPGRS